MKLSQEVLSVFPDNIKSYIYKNAEHYSGTIYEIRLISGQGIFFSTSDGIRFACNSGWLSAFPEKDALKIRQEQLEEITDRASGYSGFAHESEFKKGYITYAGGCRIGIASRLNCSGETGKINSLNIRLPVKSPEYSCPELDSLLKSLYGGLLIAGAPASGKTSLLRYCCKKLAGGDFGTYRKLCVIDERRELAGEDSASFELGDCCDVISGGKKSEGIETALRLLSPEIIVCDEIGGECESEEILSGLNSGIIFIASMHAGDIHQLARRSQFRKLFRENVFENVLLLSSERPGRINKIYSYKELSDEISGNTGDCVSYHSYRNSDCIEA